jgi:hypothetical protein
MISAGLLLNELSRFITERSEFEEKTKLFI